LRKGDHIAEGLEIERERLALAERELELKRESKIEVGLKQIESEVSRNPKIQEAMVALRKVLIEEGFG